MTAFVNPQNSLGRRRRCLPPPHVAFANPSLTLPQKWHASLFWNLSCDVDQGGIDPAWLGAQQRPCPRPPKTLLSEKPSVQTFPSVVDSLETSLCQRLHRSARGGEGRQPPRLGSPRSARLPCARPSRLPGHRVQSEALQNSRSETPAPFECRSPPPADLILPPPPSPRPRRNPSRGVSLDIFPAATLAPNAFPLHCCRRGHRASGAVTEGASGLEVGVGGEFQLARHL